MDEILKCCGEQPVIKDFTYDFFCDDRYMFNCTNCGHHIHSEEKVLDKVIRIWNNSIRIRNRTTEVKGKYYNCKM